MIYMKIGPHARGPREGRSCRGYANVDAPPSRITMNYIVNEINAVWNLIIICLSCLATTDMSTLLCRAEYIFDLATESVGALALPVSALTQFGNINSSEVYKLIFIFTPIGRFNIRSTPDGSYYCAPVYLYNIEDGVVVYIEGGFVWSVNAKEWCRDLIKTFCHHVILPHPSDSST